MLDSFCYESKNGRFVAPDDKWGNGCMLNLLEGATRLEKPEINSMDENQLMPFLLSTTSLPARWAGGVPTLFS
jgi:hypothetical protein